MWLVLYILPVYLHIVACICQGLILDWYLELIIVEEFGDTAKYENVVAFFAVFDGVIYKWCI